MGATKIKTTKNQVEQSQDDKKNGTRHEKLRMGLDKITELMSTDDC